MIENNSIKMIYIDPPYNTKSKIFEYDDNNKNWDNMMQELLKLSKVKR